MRIILALAVYALVSMTNLAQADESDTKVSRLLNGEIFAPLVNEKGQYSANVPVTGSKRGAHAVTIAKDFKVEDGSLERAFDETRTRAEQYLQNLNFDTKDLGVAFGFAYVALWQLASDKLIPEKGTTNAVNHGIHVFDSVNAEASTDDQEAMFDYLMTVAVAYPGLQNHYDQTGRTEDAQAMQKIGAELFTKTFGTTHHAVSFSDEGRFSMDIDRLAKWAEDQNAPMQKPEQEKPGKSRVLSDAGIAQAKHRATKGGVDGLASLRNRQPLISNSDVLGVGVEPGSSKGSFDFATQLYIVNYTPGPAFLALKDGTYILGPAPPADTDLEAYRNLVGNKIVKKDVSASTVYTPLVRGTTFNVYATHHTPGTGGATLRDLIFNEHGFFKHSSTSLLKTPDMGGFYGRNASSSDMSGTYFIDGNTIELEHNDGRVERLLFGVNEEMIMLGGIEYFIK